MPTLARSKSVQRPKTAKAAAGSRRGLVSVIRRRELARKIHISLELPA